MATRAITVKQLHAALQEMLDRGLGEVSAVFQTQECDRMKVGSVNYDRDEDVIILAEVQS